MKPNITSHEAGSRTSVFRFFLAVTMFEKKSHTLVILPLNPPAYAPRSKLFL